MKKIIAFLRSIRHYKLDNFDWIVIRYVEEGKSIYPGEEVEIDAFETKEDVIDYIENYIPKVEQKDVQIFKRVKL